MATARSCSDCYFRANELCALPRTEICATFRPARREGLTPPAQAPLIERAPEPGVAQLAGRAS